MVELGADGLDVRRQLKAGQVGAKDVGAEEGFGFDGHFLEGRMKKEECRVKTASREYKLADFSYQQDG